MVLLIDKTPRIDNDFNHLLMPCIGINGDRVDHIRSLGNNFFGIEDIIWWWKPRLQ
ncbi:MAG: hypothetical protein RMX96_33295 [Nostoc sp. ChiSLP02]|nr:hypothetical protein [Nostoc sp. DedSLP05]MDZ8102470.1 hypothetical protein [Nostoc sp. DedSLP01]MDZ8189700.1 hypothetical protein [Nostoc sp. ChiSLP02]